MAKPSVAAPPRKASTLPSPPLTANGSPAIPQFYQVAGVEKMRRHSCMISTTLRMVHNLMHEAAIDHGYKEEEANPWIERSKDHESEI
ncbi:hypothetical protein [Massilia phyllosphaerae]|uniref:hypothetical protein n=1 Tax=Massilia phyllosphaerae TaxID=3106034 RepID=UPI002B1CDB28|nr:hypothetical protein [Massilia sp. SGZ-792]